MKTRITIIGFLTILSLAACKKGGNADAKVADYKKQITEKKEALTALKSEIAVLEDSLAKYKVEAEELALVSVTPVKKSGFTHYLDIQAKVESDNNVLASPQMPGKVIKLYVKEGDRVSKGQVIALLDVDVAQKGIEEIKNQYELAKTVYEKQKGLWEQKIGTEIQYLQAKNNKEALEKRIETMNSQVDMAKVKAPIAGTVEETFVKEGEMAVGGPVARIVGSSDFKVIADVAESYTSSINQGDAISIEFPDLKKSVNQRITKVGEVINPMSRTFTVESRIANIAGLKPNMIAKVRLQDYANRNSIVVPVNVVQNDNGGQFVYVEKGGVAVKKPVKVGMSYGDSVEVLDGLVAGDRLITIGYLELVTNQRVTVK